MVKRIVLKVVNAVAVVAALIFWFMPLSTVTQALLCAASFGVAGNFGPRR
jgi:hypothetical protein